MHFNWQDLGDLEILEPEAVYLKGPQKFVNRVDPVSQSV